MTKMLKQASIFIIIPFFLFRCASNDKNKDFNLNQGDLLFQNTGTGEIDHAIKDVTATTLSKNYTHVGMAMQKNGNWFVMEAIPKEGICQTPLKKFLNRNKNKFNKSKTKVARLNKQYRSYIPKAIEYAVERINTPYDEIFLWDNDAYYCSELIYKMFSYQNVPKDSIPFHTHPMTFNDRTGSPMSSWVTYYKTRNQPIPEGIEGTNPNLMASSPHISFVHDYETE